jgi:aryl-alcohol dehydrogenase-like predicted oxidoreductase
MSNAVSATVVPSEPLVKLDVMPRATEWIRSLGDSGLQVSAVGLGLAALGRPGYLNIGHGTDLGPDHSPRALERRTHAVLDLAYESGVRYFDAARSYGRAEEFLSNWLLSRGLGRDEVTVGSKWGYTYTAGWRVSAESHEVKDLSADTLRRQLEETRALLGRWLALYQIHSATLDSGVLENAAVMRELAALRATGVAVGVTVTGSEQPAVIERALATGGFDSVQATFNLLERSAAPALRRAHEAGLGVIVKEALANGRLGPRAAPKPVSDAARRLRTGEDVLALAWVLGRPWVDVVLSGAATPQQLQSNLTATELSIDWGTDVELEAVARPSDEYWQERASLPWN